MATFPHRSPMTVEEYFELCRNSPDIRYEYIDGQAVMLAGGTLNHARIAKNIIVALESFLHNRACQSFTSDAIVKVPSGRYVLPDVTISCDERDHEDNECLLYPCVIFEVLSPATETFDRGRKFAFYQECSTIREYVLVSSQELRVEVFHRENEHMWTYRVFRQGEEVWLLSLDVRLSVRDIYRNVVL
ncbi:MAG: Uma2 family endonuclease [Chloroflexi bacterium]|nr:MAG: Uma2 family endonuclease [Chloroflexota bacterium]